MIDKLMLPLMPFKQAKIALPISGLKDKPPPSPSCTINTCSGRIPIDLRWSAAHPTYERPSRAIITPIYNPKTTVTTVTADAIAMKTDPQVAKFR